MILTVTPNTALDKILFVDDFAFGQTVRAHGSEEGMGGKGAVVSWILGQLGTPNIATGFAAGETGRRMVEILKTSGVRPEFVWVEGETRTNLVLARTADGVQGTITVAGLSVRPGDAEGLAERVRSLLGESTTLLCGGSLPQGMPGDWYVPLIRQAKQKGIFTVLDTSDQFLAPNLVAPPDMVKPNVAEAAVLLGRRVRGLDDAVEAVRLLSERGIAIPIVTLGEMGAVAGTSEGTYYVPPLSVRVINTAGAGDGFNAGLLRAREEGLGWEQALRWAAAVATSILLTPATGACRPDDVQALYHEARVERL